MSPLQRRMYEHETGMYGFTCRDWLEVADHALESAGVPESMRKSICRLAVASIPVEDDAEQVLQ